MLRTLFVPDLHEKNEAGEHQGNDIGNDHRHGADLQAVNQPERDARGKSAIHAQRDAIGSAGFPGESGLWNEDSGGQGRGEITDEFR